jgi:hypothetical protein
VFLIRFDERSDIARRGKQCGDAINPADFKTSGTTIHDRRLPVSQFNCQISRGNDMQDTAAAELPRLSVNERREQTDSTFRFIVNAEVNERREKTRRLRVARLDLSQESLR